MRVAQNPQEADAQRTQAEHAAAINANAGSAEIAERIADRPHASEMEGRFFFALDQRILWFSDGSTWERVIQDATPPPTDPPIVGTAVGDTIVWDGSEWIILPVGTEDTVLTSNGIGQLPAWVGAEPVGAILGGVPNNFTLNATAKRIEGWDNALNTPTFPGTVNQANGTISLTQTSWVLLTAAIIGQQGNDIKEESAFMEVDFAGSNPQRYIVDAFDIATDKTDYRTFGCAISLIAEAGHDMSLWLRATSGLGTYSFSNCSFDVFVLASAVA